MWPVCIHKDCLTTVLLYSHHMINFCRIPKQRHVHVEVPVPVPVSMTDGMMPMHMMGDMYSQGIIVFVWSSPNYLMLLSR